MSGLDALDHKIKEQGNLIRDLKAKKASKVNFNEKEPAFLFYLTDD